MEKAYIKVFTREPQKVGYPKRAGVQCTYGMSHW